MPCLKKVFTIEGEIMREIGELLEGKYRIQKVIGEGGMSIVYLAVNERVNKAWAVKEIRKDLDDQAATDSLRVELEMLKKLKHPGLPDIVDVIDTRDSMLIVMEYIEGVSLQQVLSAARKQFPETYGAQNPADVIRWAGELCSVLGYLHSQNPPIIYRDMKPSNIMLRPDGGVVLIDLGSAREIKRSGDGDTVSLGTRGYAAPEQFGGLGQTDARTDIYGLGATMYHLLTGISPAETNLEIRPLGELKSYLAGSDLERIVAKCCRRRREDRYQNCSELARDLSRARMQDVVKVRNRLEKIGALLTSTFVLSIIGILALLLNGLI